MTLASNSEILNLDQLWQNSINPKLQDAYLRQDHKSVKSVLKSISLPANRLFKDHVDVITNNGGFLTNEYITGCSSLFVSTNKRLVIFQGNSLLSVPFNEVIFYGVHNGVPMLQYKNDGQVYTYKIPNKKEMYISWVNQIVKNHKYDLDLKEISAQLYERSEDITLIDYPLLSEFIVGTDEYPNQKILNIAILFVAFLSFYILPFGRLVGEMDSLINDLSYSYYQTHGFTVFNIGMYTYSYPLTIVNVVLLLFIAMNNLKVTSTISIVGLIISLVALYNVHQVTDLHTSFSNSLVTISSGFEATGFAYLFPICYFLLVALNIGKKKSGSV